ncbi:YciI family protein [Mycolicibacterium hodleri]|uniref:YCII-related domain-containing protein n=1 Tax=Mycolicibacterium hodleri TaxID=49897 RepID=A0A502EHQ9_9MYCO|nr:YciI family protein [Mycolicibacterium hodleri]TPG36036.1 hypothetical protein EAH80_08495 [Mycolicibacterium hodleri]
MTRYLIECTIDETRLELLAAKRAEHYEFLIAHRDQIVFGGPARAEEGGPPQTMVMVVEVASTQEARRFIADEPYNRSGSFSKVAVRPWSQVIPELTSRSLQTTLESARSAEGGSGE